ncbi:acetyltransferase [Alphaproteobacteria bacterium]|nr:acetyltransferase [Alphaproteobacteria bacterium]
MKRLAILGGGGHSKVVTEAALLSGWNSIRIFDDISGTQQNTSMVLAGDFDDLINKCQDFDGCFVALGSNFERKKYFKLLKRAGAELVNIKHPSALISDKVNLENGIMLAAGTIINCDVTIEDGVIVNTGSTIDHDCMLKSFTHISPGCNLAGNVTVGEKTWVGIGTKIKENISIGESTIIGAGSVVISDMPSDSICFGIPCRQKK